MVTTKLPDGDKAKPGTKPGQRHRNKVEISRDRTTIVNLRLLNRKTVSEIARIITDQYAEQADPETGLDKDGMLPPTVKEKQIRNELKKADEEFKEDRVEEIHAKRRELIRTYAKYGGLAFEEYEASKAPRVIKTESETSGGEAGTSTTDKTVTEERVVGDKGFLSIGLQCVDKIAELEAAIPPRKTALTNPDGTEAFRFEGDEELKRLAALADELLHTNKITDKVIGG